MGNNSEDKRKDILINMHQYYANSQNHQLSMMWETVKWFTPILTLISGGLVTLYINKFLPSHNSDIGLLLIICSLGGFLLAFIAILLLKRFYTVNMRYVTMLAKTEEEMDFDKRTKTPREYYPADDYITWQGYRQHRTGKRLAEAKKSSEITSKIVVEDQLKVKMSDLNRASIYNYMKLFFYLFMVFFGWALFWIFFKML
jgi:hypothetical protein